MLSIRNEFILPPIKLGYSDGSGIVTQKHLHFYEVRSKHSGAITFETLYMDAGFMRNG